VEPTFNVSQVKAFSHLNVIFTLLHNIGFTESSAQTEGTGAAWQVPGPGSLGSEPGTVSWHISVCVEVTTELCKGAQTTPCFHLGQNFGCRQCKFLLF
jgi:hypothetical protein